MWMIYGKRTKEPYVDKQFRMLTAKGMRTTDSSKAMLSSTVRYLGRDRRTEGYSRF